MHKKKVNNISSRYVTLFSLLLLITITTTITHKQQIASAFFHEKLFEGLFGGSNTEPKITTEDKPTTTTTGTSRSSTATPKDDNIKGSAEDDVLVGLAGNDVIDGQRGIQEMTILMVLKEMII
jgi:Ca2+-binding RTX toxin-like protein